MNTSPRRHGRVLNGAVAFLSFLLVSLSALGDVRARCASLVTPEDFDAFAQEVRGDWKDIEQEYEWRVWIDSTAEYQRFVNPPHLEAAGDLIHPTEVYPNALAQYRAMKAAGFYLDAVPVGKFSPNVEMVREVHRIAMKDVYTLREKLAYKLGGGIFNIVGPGKFKKIFNFGFSPLTKTPLTDAQVAMIREEGLIKFWSLMRVGQDRNYGLLLFPGSPEKHLTDLVAWYESNKTKLSPIQLAAGFQRRFVAIHPFDNGNGRVSRLFMDRILAEFGLPPALLRDQNLDLYVSEAQWAQEVADGVAQFESMAHQALRDSKKTKMAHGAPFIGQRDHGAWINPKGVANGKMNEALFPEKGKSNFVAATGDHYVLYRDGFFYSDVGIPHLYREGMLYPVPDQNYILYGIGGAVKGDAKKGAYRRVLSAQMEEVYQDHLEVLQRISDGNLDPRSIKVVPYQSIAQANKDGRLALYPWEKEWLRRVIEIPESSPAAILAANRGGFTEFENAFNNQGNVRISSILAQYQAVDLNYARLEWHFRKIESDPKMVAAIDVARKKLWEAVRYYVKKFETNAIVYATRAFPEVVDKADLLKRLREVPQFKLFYEYLPYTRAGHAEWDTAVKEVPWNQIYLLRNDFKAIRWVGFLSEAQFAHVLKSIPGAGAFRKYVRDRLAKLTTAFTSGARAAPTDVIAQNVADAGAGATSSPKNAQQLKYMKLFQALERKIFISPYVTRGVDDQFERAYVDLYLHAVDQGQKSGVSFTTRSDQMVRGDGTLSFQGITGAKYQTYIVRMPVEHSVNNFASGWFRQYEVVVKGYSLPTRVVKTLDSADYVPALDPEMLAKFDDFVNKQQTIRLD